MRADKSRFLLELLTIGVMGRAGAGDFSGAREMDKRDFEPCKAPRSGR